MSFVQSRTKSASQGIGKPIPRKEDERLLRGEGCYTDDFSLPGQAYASVVRSPHAHARIRSIDAKDALALPGVIAVLTGSDAAQDGLKPVPFRPVSPNPHEVQLKASFLAPYPLLPADRVRFVGQAAAIVVAENAMAAKDAAERVAVDYEPLPAVTATRAAAEGPRLWDSPNVCSDTTVGNSVEEAFKRAAHVVALETTMNRVTGVPMEPRSALGTYDDQAKRYTVYASCAGPHRARAEIAGALGVPESEVRVVTRELGGNYGTRNNLYPEFALVAWAARRLGRPVKWTCERTEAFLSDEHARDLVSRSELALDAQGNFVAMRCDHVSNVGAHAVSFIPLTKGMAISTSVYRFPAASIRGRTVMSTTSPTTPYRAAGRPEMMFIIERLIDIAARRHGFDRVELRERNLIRKEELPYRTNTGLVYDSGDYVVVQARALELADWKGFEKRRRESRSRGRCRGIGLGHYVELNTGAPRERAEIRVLPGRRVEVVLGTLSAGQGHETSFAQLVAEWLAVDLAQVKLLTGDTDLTPIGGGSHSGRSMRMGAVVMAHACDRVVEQGKQRASERLEVSSKDLEFESGRFRVKGTDRSIGLFDLGLLKADYDETTPLPSYPFGCAVCEVEVDPQTGVVEVARHSTVDDCGRAVNPLILHGQTHGGIAAGVGQALWEACRYDPETGQLLSASFMDYAMPRADQLPMFDTEISEIPSTTNPLGMRGGGEGGTTPALAAVANAVVHALAEFGVEHLDLPLTPERVWRAIHDGPSP
jgi:carbon-monoxide dehydrogenase large subunit